MKYKRSVRPPWGTYVHRKREAPTEVDLSPKGSQTWERIRQGFLLFGLLVYWLTWDERIPFHVFVFSLLMTYVSDYWMAKIFK
jgi:hypothetical protein